MTHRKGMELAVNTLVMIILGIIIMGGGISLVYKIFDKAITIPGEVDRQTEETLFNMLLGSKQRIAVLDNVKTVARKDDAVFAVAIQNQVDGTEATFTVEKPLLTLVPTGAEGCQDTTIDNAPSDCPVADALSEPFTVKRYESSPFYVVARVPRGAESGEYGFVINVLQDGDVYARTKINVVVE